MKALREREKEREREREREPGYSKKERNMRVKQAYMYIEAF